VIPESVESKDYQRDNYEWAMKVISKVYDQLIAYGVPEEDARYVLPNACMTNIVVTMNARELRHFFALRCCNRAQWEIRTLANLMLSLCKEVAPVIFEDAGPSCKVLGHCPEARPCGKGVKG
jgi:thymidylate synthase (FAD)